MCDYEGKKSCYFTVLRCLSEVTLLRRSLGKDEVSIPRSTIIITSLEPCDRVPSQCHHHHSDHHYNHHSGITLNRSLASTFACN